MGVEFQFVNKGLNGADIVVPKGCRERDCRLLAESQPLLLVGSELLGMELPPARMRVVVELDLRVTLEAHRDGILDEVRAATDGWLDVVQLHLDAAKAVANAATAVACGKESI